MKTEQVKYWRIKLQYIDSKLEELSEIELLKYLSLFCNLLKKNDR